MSKPWGNIGTWAAEAEREEEEMEAIAAAAPPPDTKTYPSLREAVTAKPKKKKMSLNEFYSSAAAGGGGARPKGLTPEEMLRLPTGPRERDPEEMQYGRLGGGFSGYGGGGGRTREDSSDGQWGGGGGGRRGYGGGGGFDDDRRGQGNSRVSDFDSMPSRADEADNWATGKKAFVPSMDSGRQSRYGSIGSGGGGGGGGMGGGGSRADEVDNWAAGKKPVAVNPGRSSTFGSGFRSSGPEPDRWTRGGGGGDREVETERRRLVLNPPKAGDGGVSEQILVTNKPNPFGAARPREEILAEKGLDWRKLETEIETKKSPSSRPTSASSSRPSSAHSVRSDAVENVVTPVRPKVNPFGDAKPREVLLQERGQDWRKIDRELDRPRSIESRPETEEEKSLKEEINQLKEQFQKELAMQENKESTEAPDGDNQSSLKDVISQKEKELETLTRDFDAKVRFSPKPFERPGSGAGRTGGFSDRPSSRSGSIDESRNTEFIDRPRSRGAQDTRPGDERRSSYQGSRERPGDERRPHQGGRERGFQGSGNFDRPRSRDDKW
ncbi:Eukaryotic translation initiation factor 4B1 [Linum grandiflorum]